MSVHNYLRAVEEAWNDYDGDTLATLLSFQDSHATKHQLQIENPEADVERVLDNPIDELVAAHLRGIWATSRRDYVEAYKCQALNVQNFCKLLSSQKDDNWPLPIMYSLCLDLRLFAIKADEQLSHKGGKPGKLLSFFFAASRSLALYYSLFSSIFSVIWIFCFTYSCLYFSMIFLQ